MVVVEIGVVVRIVVAGAVKVGVAVLVAIVVGVGIRVMVVVWVRIMVRVVVIIISVGCDVSRKTRSETRNLVVISDTHCGCRLGLCPPGPIRLDDGGSYRPSAFQRGVWRYWQEFWGKWVPSVVGREPWDVVHNGDALEGVHHGATTQISHNMQDQLVIAVQVLAPVVRACHASGGRYYHVRGTEAHVGTSGMYEEVLAKQLGAVRNREGQYARYDLWKCVGDALVHLLHHVGTTGSSAHEASAVNAELTAEFVEAARWRRRPPDFVVRSHRHRFIAVDLDTADGRLGAAIVTPGWQGKTPFAWKVAGARLATPQFGGIIVRQGDAEAHYRRRIWSIRRSAEVQ